jgi:hypothetical protein
MNRLLCSFLLLLLAAQAQAGSIDIRETRVWLQDDAYLLDADLRYNPDEVVMEAMANGIPVVFRVSLAVEPDRLFSRRLADKAIDYSVRYRPLAAFYEVSSPEGGSRTFVSRSALFSYLGEVRGVRLVGLGELDPEVRYNYLVKAELDIDSLPLPMRPMAWLSSVWKLSSGWREWPLTP